jgi:hypothetical protein
MVVLLFRTEKWLLDGKSLLPTSRRLFVESLTIIVHYPVTPKRIREVQHIITSNRNTASAFTVRIGGRDVGVYTTVRLETASSDGHSDSMPSWEISADIRIAAEVIT